MATFTLPGADIRGYYQKLGIQLPERPCFEASVRCFANPDAHRREDRNPSCSVNLVSGAWKCHACGAHGGAYDAAWRTGYTPRAAIDLMIAHGLTDRRARLQTARELLNASARPSQADTRTRAREGIGTISRNSSSEAVRRPVLPRQARRQRRCAAPGGLSPRPIALP